MTEPEFYDDEPDDADTQQTQDGNPNLRQLREKAKKYDSMSTDLDQLRRENAFLKAGIPDTPQGRLLQKAYDGEPTPEAIRQFAVEHGVMDQSDLDDVSSDELAALDRADAASSGGSFTPPRPPDMNAILRSATGRR